MSIAKYEVYICDRCHSREEAAIIESGYGGEKSTGDFRRWSTVRIERFLPKPYYPNQMEWRKENTLLCPTCMKEYRGLENEFEEKKKEWFRDAQDDVDQR